MQHGCGCRCPFFVHSLHQLEVVSVCTLCIVFMCNFVEVILKQWNSHGVEKIEVKIIKVGNNQIFQEIKLRSVLCCLWLSLSHIKLQFLKRKAGVRHNLFQHLLKTLLYLRRDTIWLPFWLKMQACSNWEPVKGVILLDMSNKTNDSSWLLQEVIYLGMCACIIFLFHKTTYGIAGIYV
jgi:hypothetical protein